MFPFPEVVDSNKPFRRNIPLMCFCKGGLPGAGGVTCISCLCSLCRGLQPSGPPRASVFLRRAGWRTGDWHLSPKAMTRWQNACFHWMIQSNWISPGQPVWFCLQHPAFSYAKTVVSSLFLVSSKVTQMRTIWSSVHRVHGMVKRFWKLSLVPAPHWGEALQWSNGQRKVLEASLVLLLDQPPSVSGFTEQCANGYLVWWNEL